MTVPVYRVLVTAVQTTGGGGHVYVSTNSGATWTETQPTTTAEWIAVTVSADGSKIAVIDFDFGFVYTSTDYGTTWTERYYDYVWWDIVSSADGSKLFLNDMWDTMHVSVDSGANWSTSTVSGVEFSYMTVSFNGERVAVSDYYDGVLTSTTTGATWTVETDMSGCSCDFIAGSDDGLVLYVSDNTTVWRGVAGAPQFSSVATSTGTSTATITWSTNLSGTSIVNYGTTDSLGIKATGVGTTSHNITLTGLDTCTTYHYQLESTESNYSQVGTSSLATFTTSGDCYGSTGADIELDIDGGQITVTGGNPNNTTAVTFNVPYSVVAGGASITFPSGTVLTRSDAGAMDLLNFTINNVTSALQSAYVGDIAGAISVGLTNLNLSFTQNATLTIPVSTTYNGQTLNVYSQQEGSSTWDLETTCLVTSGQCVFLANHATTFSAGDEPQEAVSQSSGSGGGTRIKTIPREESIVGPVLANIDPDSRTGILLRIIEILKQVIELQKRLLKNF